MITVLINIYSEIAVTAFFNIESVSLTLFKYKISYYILVRELPKKKLLTNY